MKGYPQSEAAEMAQMPRGSASAYDRHSRPESEIRADLARQLERIVRSFEASLT